MPTQSSSLSCFAVTAPGLEPLCADELSALGARGKTDTGGVAFRGDITALARANLWLRTASRVLVRVAEFRATAFHELERHAKRIDWSRFVTANAHVAFRVTCRKSKLYHSDAVAQRFEEAVRRAVPGVETGRATATEDEDEASPGADRQLFVVRFANDVCSVSVDSSGALLHLRGYRQQLAKAPLRETLAAAVLLGAGWTGETALVDPMCGSGTIPIEAALIARRIAPGRDRTFAFLGWPEVDASLWSSLVDGGARARAARTRRVESQATIATPARSPRRARMRRAPASPTTSRSTHSRSPRSPSSAAGSVRRIHRMVCALARGDRLRNLYAQLGNVARRRARVDACAALRGSALERHMRLDFEERFATRNGGIPCGWSSRRFRDPS